MELQLHGHFIQVTLSKRNLLALLQKVDLPEGDSQRTLFRHFDHHVLIVTAEADDEHYQGREPGPMREDAERFIRESTETP